MELNLTHAKPAAFDESGVQFGWDSTSIKLAEACPRKYQLKMIEGWQKRGPGKSVHLRFGGHYATAIEHYHKAKANGVEHDEAVLDVVAEALVDTWDRTEEKPEGEAWDSFDNLKTRATLIRSIVWYLEHYKNDSAAPIILDSGKAAVELSFKLPADNGVVLSGHFDRIAEYEGNKYVMDQKTTGSALGPYYFNQYDPDTQMSMYTFAGQAVFGVPVSGVIIDAAQILVGGTRFIRGLTMRTKGKLDEWYDQTMWRIALTQQMTRENYFPMNPSSCGNFGGCEYRGICSLDPKARTKFLEADFVRGERWDPLKSR